MWGLAIGAASAGSGPWVVGEDSFTVFVGTDAQRIGKLAIEDRDGRDVLDVAEGLQRFGVKGIGTIGLGPVVDLQVSVPWSQAVVTRDDHPLCVALGLGACETTQGVGVIESRVKVNAVNEFFGAPLSFSFGGDVRYGLFTSATRQRITNLGEGTLDVGPFLVVGRTAGLGRGFWSGWFETGFRYRVPNSDTFPQFAGQEAVPGSEFTAATELLIGPTSTFAIGPRVNALYRPFGLDWYEVDLTDPDRFAALRVANVRVGGVFIVRAPTVALSCAFLQTVYGYNNPSDTFLVDVGLQFNGSLRRVGNE